MGRSRRMVVLHEYLSWYPRKFGDPLAVAEYTLRDIICQFRCPYSDRDFYICEWANTIEPLSLLGNSQQAIEDFERLQPGERPSRLSTLTRIKKAIDAWFTYLEYVITDESKYKDYYEDGSVYDVESIVGKVTNGGEEPQYTVKWCLNVLTDLELEREAEQKFHQFKRQLKAGIDTSEFSAAIQRKFIKCTSKLMDTQAKKDGFDLIEQKVENHLGPQKFAKLLQYKDDDDEKDMDWTPSSDRYVL